MSAHADSPASLSAGAHLQAPSRGVWLALCAICFAVAALACALRPTGVDVSWLMTLNERVLAGQRAYIDFFEANPPMSILIYLPAVLLGRALAVAPEIMVNALVLLGAAASLLLSGAILAAILDERRLWRFAACGAFVFTVLPIGVFGEREHIGVIALMPFVALMAVRAEGAHVRRALAVLTGLGCGVAVAIKPHFAAPAGLALLAACWRTRSLRLLFGAETWAAAAVVALYALTIVMAFQGFLQFLPVIVDTYLPVRESLWTLVVSPPVFAASLAAAIALAAHAGKLRAPIALPLFCAAGGGALMYLVQGKAWPYQSYPMLAFAVLGVASFAATRRENGSTPCAAPNAFDALVLTGLAGVAVIGAHWLSLRGDYPRLNRPVAALARSPRLLSISSDIGVGHPLVRDLGGEWVGSFCNQWITASVLTLEEAGNTTPERRARLEALARWDKQILLRDITRGNPDVILIDVRRFDWSAWAHADPALAGALGRFRRMQTVQGIEIWARD